MIIVTLFAIQTTLLFTVCSSIMVELAVCECVSNRLKRPTGKWATAPTWDEIGPLRSASPEPVGPTMESVTRSVVLKPGLSVRLLCSSSSSTPRLAIAR